MFSVDRSTVLRAYLFLMLHCVPPYCQPFYRVHCAFCFTHLNESAPFGLTIHAGPTVQTRPAVLAGPTAQTRPAVLAGPTVQTRPAELAGPTVQTRPAVLAGPTVLQFLPCKRDSCQWIRSAPSLLAEQ
jgi:hypothetical protein